MIRINLLPVRAEKRKETSRKHVALAAGFLVILAIAVLGVQLAMNSRVDDRKARIARQEAAIAQLDVKIKEVEGYKATIKELTDKVNVVRGLELRQRGPAQAFLELAKLCPEKLWIKSLSDKGGNLTIKGSAIDRQTLAIFMMDMEKSTLFTSVRLVVAKQEIVSEKELQDFTLTTRLVLPKLDKAPTPDSGKAG